MQKLLAASLFLLILLFFKVSLSAVPGPSFLSLTRCQGQLIGVNSAYTGAEILTFAYRDQPILPLFNLKGYYLDNGGFVGNIGSGVRFMPTGTSLIYGATAFYDYRREHHSSFNRLGLGFEIFSPCFGFRANGYLPIGKQNVHIKRCIFNNYIGDFIIIRDDRLLHRGGADFLFDVWLKKLQCGSLRVGLGGYYFNGSACRSSIYGPEYRVTVYFNHNVSLGIVGTKDQVFGNKLQACLSITFPFRCGSMIEEGPFQRIQRNDTLILQRKSCWKTNF